MTVKGLSVHINLPVAINVDMKRQTRRHGLQQKRKHKSMNINVDMQIKMWPGTFA